MVADRRRRLEDAFWARHSNPTSGWTRVPTGPVVVYALYRRRWRLLGAALFWAAINPVLYRPPASADAWMTRAVLAERWWIRTADNRTLGLGYPNLLNTGSAGGAVCALVGAWRRRPVATAVGTALMVGLKLLWLRALVRRFDRRAAERSDG